MWKRQIWREAYIDLIGKVLFIFLQNHKIVNDFNLITKIFKIFGILIVRNNYTKTFKFRFLNLITQKESTYIIPFISEGIKLLVEKYKCDNLCGEIVSLVIEWRRNNIQIDPTASKHCTHSIICLTTLMPDIMMSEIVNLIDYLFDESPLLRMYVLNIITEVTINVLNNSCRDERSREIRNLFIQQLDIHLLDKSTSVRRQVLALWCKMQIKGMIPAEKVPHVIRRISGRLNDMAPAVRKNAIIFLTTFIESNPFGSQVIILILG